MYEIKNATKIHNKKNTKKLANKETAKKGSTPCPQKKLTVGFWSISPSNFHQI